MLILTIVGLTPASGSASDDFPSADGAEMLTPGAIDQSIPGATTIQSFVEDGQTLWAEGLDLPADHTLNFDLVSPDSTHWNHVGGDFGAHINGTVVSGPGNTIVFASPFGVFIGAEAVLDVGSLVAVGADVLNSQMSQDLPFLELSGAIENQGVIRANADVLFYGAQVRNSGEILAPNGQVLLLGADAIHFLSADTITQSLVDPPDFVAVTGGGRVENEGRIAATNASMLGSRVSNYGQVEIADGSLMMIGADAIYVSQLDNPVLIRLPHATSRTSSSPETLEYRVENHGRIEAGRGHVRLAASDPLGFGIRQGAGISGSEAGIAARRIEIEGGEVGRVQLSGSLDATASGEDEIGGEIDVTGSIIALVDATLDASGDAGGGSIQVGGEERGMGELQRARAVVMDADSVIRADARVDGDGGRAIVFAEDLTSIDGQISARGGQEGGDGGFIETSGLRKFRITRTPDASAPGGDAGAWLIDPYAINVVPDDPALDCSGTDSCLNRSLEAILAPNFDDAAFDGVLRTVGPQSGIATPNDLSANLLIRALEVGTDITLSTEAFDPNSPEAPEGDGTPGGEGDITIDAPIEIRNGGTLRGTQASLTLLAAGSIYINEDISVRDAGDTTTADLSLDVELRANDQAQRDPLTGFGTDRLRGGVNLDANVRTGGGDFTTSGISFQQTAGSTVETDGGDVSIIAGSLDDAQDPTIYPRLETASETVPTTSSNPDVVIAGTIDTSRQSDDPGTGGEIDVLASGVQVITAQAGNDLLQVDTGQITLAPTGTLSSGGGNISLEGGTGENTFAGSVDLTAGTIDASRSIDPARPTDDPDAGGNVTIDANRIDALGNNGTLDVQLIDVTRGEGGAISSSGATVTTGGGTLSIGSTATQRIVLDGTFDTTDGTPDMTPGELNEDGLMSIVALDEAGIGDGRYGRGSISIGENGPATLRSAGIAISSRDVTTGLGSNPVSIIATGETDATIDESSLGLDPDFNTSTDETVARQGEVQISGERQITFNPDTLISGETILIGAAATPSLLNGEETNGAGALLPAEPLDLVRLRFNGTGGTTASAGVRLEADDIAISVGDGTTITSGLVFEEIEEEVPPMSGMFQPTPFGLERGTRGEYAGLQLRDQSGALRPETLSIRQDGDLTVDDGVATVATDLFLGGRSGTATTTGAFADAAIGAEGQRIALESSDGTLTIEDAAGLSSDIAPAGGDDGLSWVVLNGGLLLPPDDMTADPLTESVIFSGSFLGDSAFNVEGLTVSTPDDFTITTQVVGAIGSAAELVFEAGRNTGVAGAAEDGTLTVENGVDLQASDTLALRAGASGFGDLVFEAGAMTTTLSANRHELRAGAGRDSQNLDPADRPEIQGILPVEFRDAAGNDFQSTGLTELAFEVRQDAAIDAATHLPIFDNFTSTAITSFDGVGAITPVSYAARSDFGSIDLTTDTTDGGRFTAAALSLVGLQSALPAIQVNETFAFIGPSIELGGVGDFTFTEALADAFNPTGIPAQARERVTLRSGLNGIGSLFFDGAGVVVTAPRIDLVASDGTGNDALGQIFVAGASFDLSGAAPGERTFVYQEDGDVQFFDLPTAAQFIGGLPNILALRSDSGLIDITGFDATTLPIDLSTNARLIFEADSVELLEADGSDLELTATEASPDPLTDPLRNLKLRFRANTLRLEAFLAGTSVGRGRVLLGPRAGDSPPVGAQPDAAFSNESILIEAFDGETDIATVTNLGTPSQVEGNPLLYDLTTGRGPTVMIIDQDGVVAPDELPDRLAISGNLARSLFDEDDGTPIRTTYALDSRWESITLASSNVSGSDLILGTSGVPLGVDITFNAGGAYDFGDLGVFTSESIFVGDGVSMTADESITLAAALIGPTPLTAIDATNPMGNLVFQGVGTTTLAANQIQLSAGPPFSVTNPDGTNGLADGERDEIDQSDLAQVDLTGLGSVDWTGARETSLISVEQSRSFDLASSEGDILTPLQAGPSPGEWQTVELASYQGTLNVVSPDLIMAETQDLTLGLLAVDSVVVVNSGVADPFSTASSGQGQVRIEGNDITFRGDDGVELLLDTPNLRLLGSTFLTGFEPIRELFRLLALDPEILRPIVRVSQSGDFSGTTLVRANRYLREDINFFTGVVTEIPRESLSQVDLELVSRGDDFVFGDNIREGASFSNLIVRTNAGALLPTPTANVLFALNGLTPGYTFDEWGAPDLDATDFAALQLSSLDVESGGGAGTITIAPFDAGSPTPPFGDGAFTLETAGDQRLVGELALQDTLVTNGRDMRFTGDVYRDVPSQAGLILETSGDVFFEENVGTNSLGVLASEFLSFFWILFDSDSESTTPSVQFGQRTGLGPDDDIAEMPVDSDQLVLTEGDIVFATARLNEPDNPADDNDGDFLEDLVIAVESATTLADVESVFDNFDLGRTELSPFATIGKSLGDLSFMSSMGGHFLMASGERLSVGGTANIDHAGAVVTLGDAAALQIMIAASQLGLVRRNAGTTFGPAGASAQDGGSSILANLIDFGGLTPEVIGLGKTPRFGVVNPFDPTNPAFLGAFPVAAMLPGSGPIEVGAFRFLGTGFDDRVPSLLPVGASRSELTGAYGPRRVPLPSGFYREVAPLPDPDRLMELAVDAYDTPTYVHLARLQGAAIIDDLVFSADDFAGDATASVTDSRLNAEDAEAAIALYEELFGTDGKRAGEVREVLQSALDRYLETTRARRVIGFELRRFVKNRPSTLLEAYTTLDRLDSLFRYHRRLGLSPGEFRRIQRGWLKQIQPDGITLDELSEAIHPSRYVRGSDILDIFGR